jgi:hypothetical protein
MNPDEGRDPMHRNPFQMRANKANAQKSTGPRTPEGKARSRLNGRKHGMCCEHALTAEEAPDFEAKLRRCAAEEAPHGELEHDSLRRAVLATFRMRHCERQAARRIDARADAMAIERVAKDEKAVEDCLARLPDPEALETLLGLSMGRMALRDRWLDLAHEAALLGCLDRATLDRARDMLGAEGQQAWDALVAEHAAGPGLVPAVHAFAIRQAEAHKAEARALTEGPEAEQYEAMLDEARVDPSPEAQLTHRYEVAAERAFYKGWGEVKKGRRCRERDAERRYRAYLRGDLGAPDLAGLQAMIGPAPAPAQAPGGESAPGAAGADPSPGDATDVLIDAVRLLARRMASGDPAAAASSGAGGPAPPPGPGPGRDDDAGHVEARVPAPASSRDEGPVLRPEPRSSCDGRAEDEAHGPTPAPTGEDLNSKAATPAPASSGQGGPVLRPEPRSFRDGRAEDEAHGPTPAPASRGGPTPGAAADALYDYFMGLAQEALAFEAELKGLVEEAASCGANGPVLRPEPRSCPDDRGDPDASPSPGRDDDEEELRGLSGEELYLRKEARAFRAWEGLLRDIARRERAVTGGELIGPPFAQRHGRAVIERYFPLLCARPGFYEDLVARLDTL